VSESISQTDKGIQAENTEKAKRRRGMARLNIVKVTTMSIHDFPSQKALIKLELKLGRFGFFFFRKFESNS